MKKNYYDPEFRVAMYDFEAMMENFSADSEPEGGIKVDDDENPNDLFYSDGG